MEIAFSLGPVTVHWYSIMIVAAILAGIFMATIEAKRRGEDHEHVLSMVVVIVPLAIIGARLYHVLHRWEYYSQYPSQIIGGYGLGIFGAVAGGVIGIIIYSKWKGLSIPRWMDIYAPGLLLGQAIGRWGNYFNQELYGRPTDLPWGIYIDPEHREAGVQAYDHFHPLFLYEGLWNLLGCFLLMFLGRKLKHRLMDGDIVLGYFVWYATGRAALEGLRLNVWTIGGLPTARWVSAIIILCCIGIFAYRRYRKRSRKHFIS